MKKTLNFSAKFKSTDGKDTEQTLAKLLADLLASESRGPAIKFLGWIETLSGEQCLDLDEADAKLLEDTIEKNERVVILLKGQLLRIFLTK